LAKRLRTVALLALVLAGRSGKPAAAALPIGCQPVELNPADITLPY